MTESSWCTGKLLSTYRGEIDNECFKVSDMGCLFIEKNTER
ncbi:hypothetical protein [Clostridium botulinum]|nr:hypothetical protein [Clostridium botulinum]